MNPKPETNDGRRFIEAGTKQPVHPDALVERILASCTPQPEEEDFWAVVVMLRKGQRPIFAMNGSLRPTVQHVVRLIGRNKIRTGKQQYHLLTFQGEKARWAMEHVKRAPGFTTLMFFGGGEKLFSNFDPKTTAISLDEDYVTL